MPVQLRAGSAGSVVRRAGRTVSSTGISGDEGSNFLEVAGRRRSRARPSCAFSKDTSVAERPAHVRRCGAGGSCRRAGRRCSGAPQVTSSGLGSSGIGPAAFGHAPSCGTGWTTPGYVAVPRADKDFAPPAVPRPHRRSALLRPPPRRTARRHPRAMLARATPLLRVARGDVGRSARHRALHGALQWHALASRQRHGLRWPTHVIPDTHACWRVTPASKP